MAFLRKGFLKSANRRNELLCQLDPAPFAAIVFAIFFLFLSPHMITDVPSHMWTAADRVTLQHAKNYQGKREDTIWITVSGMVRFTFETPAFLQINCPTKFAMRY